MNCPADGFFRWWIDICPGEQVSATLKREFTEEALDGVDDKELEKLWSNGTTVYKGYVDDPRNTDNSWMETEVVNFHDETGLLSKAKFKVKSVWN